MYTLLTGILRYLHISDSKLNSLFAPKKEGKPLPSPRPFPFPSLDVGCMSTHFLHGNTFLISKIPRTSMWVFKHCPKSRLHHLNSGVEHQSPRPSTAASSLSISILQTPLLWSWGKRRSWPAWPSWIFTDTSWGKKRHLTPLTHNFQAKNSLNPYTEAFFFLISFLKYYTYISKQNI